jgi:transcription elongation factor GreA
MAQKPDTENPRLSQAAFDRLQAELDELQTSGRKQIAERLQRARELGDLSENAEYHETKNQQGMMEARIRKLEHILKNAQIVEGPISTEAAVAGTIVTLRPLDGSDQESYLLAASSEERAKDVRTVTIGSPLGQALSGKTVGQKVEYVAPGGTFSYELVKLEPWDAQA